jgi:hypothetical protein
MEPSPVWMVSVWPPPFILPWTRDLLRIPSTVIDMSELTYPSLVRASTSTGRSLGRATSMLPSPAGAKSERLVHATSLAAGLDIQPRQIIVQWWRTDRDRSVE